MSDCVEVFTEIEEPLYVIEIHSGDCDVVEVIEPAIEVSFPCSTTVNNTFITTPDAQISEYTAAEPLTVNKVVAINGAGQVYLADKDDFDSVSDVVGITKQSAGIGQLVQVVEFGRITGAALGTSGTNYWLGNAGALVTDPPITGAWLFIGTQLESGVINIRIGEPKIRS